MDKIIIEDWYLQKEYLPSKVWSHDKGHNGGYIADYTKGQKSYRVVGTEDQIKKWSDSQDFILDEVYGYNPIKKGSYWDGIVCGERADRPTREEYNNKYQRDLDTYTEMYIRNKKEVLILRTN
tara:strand:+ start:11658 stop:12026 length:369 start_codon:yes stop_codon:yes gene_type:complete